MIKRSSPGFITFMITSDLGLTVLALQVAKVLRLHGGQEVAGSTSTLFPHSIWFYGLVSGIWLVVFTLMSVYDVHRTFRAVDEFERVSVATFLALFVLAGTQYLIGRELPQLLFLSFGELGLILLLAWRALIRAAFRVWGIGLPYVAQRVLIVGAGSVGRRIEVMLAGYRQSGIEILGYLDDDPAKGSDERDGAPVLGLVHDAHRVVVEQRVDEVIIALPLRAHQRIVELVLELERTPVRIHVVPDLFDLAFSPKVEEFNGIPMVGLREPAIEGYPRLAKRVFDLALSSLGLVATLPVMGFIAVAITLDSPGPIIFKQRRVGENGRLFWMYKFRSMCQDAEKRQQEGLQPDPGGVVVHKRANDPRVTRVGRVIRATSLDELPQLVNILRGDMSLVGPRPEMPSLVDKYEPWQRRRFAVPQGLTGWWQINGRSDKPMHLHTEEDLYYIQNYSLLLDLRILGRTVGAVLKRKGAY